MNENTTTSTTINSRQAIEVAIAAIGESNPPATAKLNAMLAQMDKRNAKVKEKRAEKPSKNAVANAPIKDAIYQHLVDNKGKRFTEADLGVVINSTHNKAGSLVRQLVTEGKVKSDSQKFPKIGDRKVYFVE